MWRLWRGVVARNLSWTGRVGESDACSNDEFMIFAIKYILRKVLYWFIHSFCS